VTYETRLTPDQKSELIEGFMKVHGINIFNRMYCGIEYRGHGCWRQFRIVCRSPVKENNKENNVDGGWIMLDSSFRTYRTTIDKIDIILLKSAMKFEHAIRRAHAA